MEQKIKAGETESLSRPHESPAYIASGRNDLLKLSLMSFADAE